MATVQKVGARLYKTVSGKKTAYGMTEDSAVERLAPHIQVTVDNDGLDAVETAPQAFGHYANVFNTSKAALTFTSKHRPGHVVVKVGRKFVPATPEFAKKMGLKVIKESSK